MLLGGTLGETRGVATPPLAGGGYAGPAWMLTPVAGVRVPAREPIAIITTIAIVLSVLDPMVLMLTGAELRLGVSWRSACASGRVLGFFIVVDRCCRGLVALSAPCSMLAAIGSSSKGHLGQLSDMATNPRTSPSPAAPPLLVGPMAGTLGQRTSGPRYRMLQLQMSGLTSAAGVSTLLTS